MTDILPTPKYFKTDCGLEYSWVEGYGFFDKDGRGLTDKQMAIALTHYHCNNAQDNYLHWGWRLAAVVGGCVIAAEAWPVVILGGLWTEYVRYKAGEQGHSQGIVGAIDRFAQHNIEASRARMTEAVEQYQRTFN